MLQEIDLTILEEVYIPVGNQTQPSKVILMEMVLSLT